MQTTFVMVKCELGKAYDAGHAEMLPARRRRAIGGRVLVGLGPSDFSGKADIWRRLGHGAF